MTDYPTPTDYLNRAEREAAYWREQADKLAEALEGTLRCFDIREGLSLRDEQAIKAATATLAAYNAERLAGDARNKPQDLFRHHREIPLTEWRR